MKFAIAAQARGQSRGIAQFIAALDDKLVIEQVNRWLVNFTPIGEGLLSMISQMCRI